MPPSLDICHACNRFLWPGEQSCPHCGADVAEAAEAHAEDVRRRRKLIAEVEELIRQAQESRTADQADRAAV